MVGRDNPHEIGVRATLEPGRAIAALPTVEPLVLPEILEPEMSRETPPVGATKNATGRSASTPALWQKSAKAT